MMSINIEFLALIVSFLSLCTVIFGFRLTVNTMKRNTINAEAANYHNSLEHQKDTWLQFFLNDAVDGDEMLVWHLQQKGIENKSRLENKKALFILLRLDVYEEMLLLKEKDILSQGQIAGWYNAIKRDFKSEDFKSIFEVVSEYYHPKLNEYYKSIMQF